MILWVKVASQTHKRTLSADVPSKKKKVDDATKKVTIKPNSESSFKSHVKKMDEVESIYEELEERHADEAKFSQEQLRAWAHMIQLKKHSSLEKPPNKPFFHCAKSAESGPVGISPSKRITLRSECIDQLDKWHKLMERGAITQEEYKDLQSTIMSDIKKF